MAIGPVRAASRRSTGLPQFGTLLSWALTISLGLTTTYIFADGCPFYLMTGLDCPGCGGTRAALCLLHGRIANALHYNALAVAAPLAYLIYLARCRGARPKHPRIVIATTVVVVAGWTIFRNIPLFDWFNTSWQQ